MEDNDDAYLNCYLTLLLELTLLVVNQILNIYIFLNLFDLSINL